MALSKDLVIEQGKTFVQVIRWYSPPYIYKPIVSTIKGAPTRMTVMDHGLPNGWRVAIVSVQNMQDINSSIPLNDINRFQQVTVLDENTVEFNSLNSSQFPGDPSGGFLQFYTPVSLSGVSLRMQIRDKIGGTLLASTEAADGPAKVITPTVEDPSKVASVSISASDTAGIEWRKGVYDIEAVCADASVFLLMYGKVRLQPEVTRT